VPVSGPFLQKLAVRKLAELIGTVSEDSKIRKRYREATFGTTWLDGFKKRNGVRSLRITGEAANVPEDYTTAMNLLVTALEALDLNPSRIYNFD
jgi:hypothetical protein